jgi:GNAT superfamily N-acetyltransferase
MDTTRFQFISPATFESYRTIVAPLAELCWPEFMLHDPISNEHWGALFESFPDYQFGIYDTGSDRVAAMGNSVPLNWDDDIKNLPEKGWDWAFEQAVHDHRTGLEPNIQCAIQIAVHPEYQGQGLSKSMVRAMRAVGISKGFQGLIAPVRPNQKKLYPLTDIDHYIGWKTKDGQPFDTWIRVHIKAGAKIVKVCHQSMVIRGKIADWESWTSLKFSESGRFIIPGALNPIEISLEKDDGLYVEPNVWIFHELT